MKNNAAFIVHYIKEGEMFESADIITESRLVKDLKKEYANKYNEPIKTKLFDQLASEAIKQMCGQSIDRLQYQSKLASFVNTLRVYTTITLLQFNEIVDFYHKQLNTTAAG